MESHYLLDCCWTLLQSNTSPHRFFYSAFAKCLRSLPKSGCSLVREQALVLTIYVRDISHGLGQRDLFYEMIRLWEVEFPKVGYSILPIALESYNPFPYGSYRDVVGLMNYLVHDCDYKTSHPLVCSAFHYLYTGFLEECAYFRHHGVCSTPLVKWIPREKSKKGGYLFEALALKYADPKQQFGQFTRRASDGNLRALRKIISRMRAPSKSMESWLCQKKSIPVHWKEMSIPHHVVHYHHVFLKNFTLMENEADHKKLFTRYLLLKHLVQRSDHKYKSAYQFRRIYNLPYVFPGSIGKLVKRGIEYLQGSRDQNDLEEYSLLNLSWKSLVLSWVRKYQSHEYRSVLVLNESVYSLSSCQSIGIALLLGETCATGNAFLFHNGIQEYEFPVSSTLCFVNNLKTLYTGLQEYEFGFQKERETFLQSRNHNECIIMDGKCHVSDPLSFVGQNEMGSYKELNHVYGAILGHNRYDYVRSKYKLMEPTY